jgi:hypothetical protein
LVKLPVMTAVEIAPALTPLGLERERHTGRPCRGR